MRRQDRRREERNRVFPAALDLVERLVRRLVERLKRVPVALVHRDANTDGHRDAGRHRHPPQ